MKSLDELKELKEQSFNKIELRLDNRKYKLVVHYFDKDELISGKYLMSNTESGATSFK